MWGGIAAFYLIGLALFVAGACRLSGEADDRADQLSDLNEIGGL